MTDNIIGRKIQMAIVWHGETPKSLSRKADIYSEEVIDYLVGDRTPDSTTLIAISKALDVSIDWLMTDLDTTDELMQDGLKYHKMKDNIDMTPGQLISWYKFKQKMAEGE